MGIMDSIQREITDEGRGQLKREKCSENRIHVPPIRREGDEGILQECKKESLEANAQQSRGGTSSAHSSTLRRESRRRFLHRENYNEKRKKDKYGAALQKARYTPRDDGPVQVKM